MHIFKVFKRQLAFELITLGNNMIYTEPNHNKRNFVVFCFEDNKKFREDLNEINS